MAGKFWVIEGCDGAGKGTQAKMLVESLRSRRILGANEVHLWSFPNYKIEPFGPMIRSYLNGEFGDANATNPYFISMLYAFDRWQDSSRMKSLLQHNDWIVCDRYVESNMAFQASKIDNPNQRKRFLDWLFNLEYQRLDLPKPDGVIFLSLPPEQSILRTDARRANEENGTGRIGKKDIHEQDGDVVRRSFKQYHQLAKKYRWNVIDCYENGSELTREDVAQRIWKIVVDK